MSCQKEPFYNFQEQEQEKRLKKISLNEFKSRVGETKDYEKLSKLFDTKKRNTTIFGRLEQTDNSWLITDEIAMIEKGGATFYTFRVGTEIESISFYNFVVVMDENSNILSTRILEYIPSNTWLQDTSQPFSGEIKTQENNIFSDTDVDALFLARGSRQCITSASGAWECGYGNNHGPGECNASSFEYIITVKYGPCPAEFTIGEDDGYPIDTTSGSGGGSSGGTSNNNDDNCVPSIENPCDEDETTILTPRDDEEEDNCSSSEEGFNAYYSANSPFNVDLSSVRNCYNIDTEDVVENQKFMCIYNKLTQSPKFKTLFLDTFGESDNLNVKFEVVDSIPGANGQAGPLPDVINTIDPTTGQVNLSLLIKIGKNYMNSSSAIAVAKTIMHESIHAYLILKHIKCNAGTPFDEIIEDINDKSLEELLNYYYTECAPDEDQHEFMFEHMIPTMSEILADVRDELIPLNHQQNAETEMFINENNPSTYPDGSYIQDVPWSWDEFYKYLSMAGLHNSSAFHLEYPDNPPSVGYLNYVHYRDTGVGSFMKECID